MITIRGHGKDTKKVPYDYSQAEKAKHLEENIFLERGDRGSGTIGVGSPQRRRGRRE